MNRSSKQKVTKYNAVIHHRKTRCKFEEDLTSYRGIGVRKNRRVERARRNLYNALAEIMVAKTLPQTLGALKMIYNDALEETRDLTHYQLQNYRYGQEHHS